MQFQPISVIGLTPEQQLRVVRLNCLGSLFYFTKVALRRKRLTEGLHKPFCQTLERAHIKDVIEMPRDHFKSTCASESLPMWKSLPIMQQDIDLFYQYGFTHEFVRWMMTVHNPNLRNLLVSENITNAAKLGRKIRWHYESNSVYRTLFPETLPDTSCTWTDFSLHVKRPVQTTGGAHGEGTFDFLGVGSAAQSRHYNGILIEDDLVGRAAVESQSIMDKTIEYHRLLPGLFESEDNINDNDELIIGNRWSYYDLNSWVMENESDLFRFESHSALGGCCELHSPDTPIFPEEFSKEKLEKLRKRFGNHNFNCQFLNNPAAPEGADFQVAWLNYFSLVEDKGEIVIRHEVKDGNVLPDIPVSHLNKAMTVDPNHSGNAGRGRCRHAVVAAGQSDSGNYYLLQTWAQAASYDTFYDKIFEIATKWGLHRCGVETIAAQRYIKHHIEYLTMVKAYRLAIDELKGEVENPDGSMSHKKESRIFNVVAPLAEYGRLWIQRTQTDFHNEYMTFPSGKFKDLLDAFAYLPQLVRRPVDWRTQMDMINANRERMAQLGRPYSVGYGQHHA